MNKHIVPGILMIVLLSLSLRAVTPQKWEIRNKEDFLKGRFEGISLSFEGTLSLAPREDIIEGPAEEFYLSLLPLSDGALFLGTGHGGKIYLIGKSGKPELYFQAAEMDITCLARDPKGVLYAGTSPNGKIYKITGKGTGEEFFNPSEKYVWDLMLTESGTLLAAVGESGGIYEINSQGEGRMILKAEENHILCLRKGRNGDIFAGTGGGGLIYRLNSKGRVSVVFESPYEEIRSLALDKGGTVYASASGKPTRQKKGESAPPDAVADSEATVTASASGARLSPDAATASGQTLGKEPGALYKISPDGVAKKLWSAEDEIVYSLVWNEDNSSIHFGTGAKGRIYAVDKDENVSLLLQDNSEQAYLLVPRESKTFVVANNPCSLRVFYPEQRFSGEYLSSVLDAKTVSDWGRIEWMAESGTGTTLQLLTRSGNSFDPNQTWSEWSPPYQKSGERILSPKARFIQYKAMFKTPSGKSSPALQKIEIFYLQTNIAPVFSGLKLLGPNEVFLKMPDQGDVILGMDDGVSERTRNEEASQNAVIAKKAERKGFRTATWDADDANGDRLIYKVSIRKEGERTWRVLQSKWEEQVYAFDTFSFPDGTYFLKITASDSPSNPQGMELETEKVGPPLVIDNSLPLIKGFSAVRNAGRLDVGFQAEDSCSHIEEVKVLVRPAPWRVVFPTDGICDSKTEDFKFTVNLPVDSDAMITVRVKDNFGNVGVWTQTF